MRSATAPQPRIAIIGSGFSGLCLAIQLQKAGFEDFTLYEKSPKLGGTWLDNTYPGAECDIPAFSYCYSFEQKTDWSARWVGHAEIRDYMEHCARKHDLHRRIRFDTEIARARFDEERGVWSLTTKGGEQIEAEILVSGVGQLNRPQTPSLPGFESFRGESFHSARWDHAVDLRGKRVAVIGNAASAIQFIPEIAGQVQQLTIFQRSANWMLPRGNAPYSAAAHRRFARFPWLAKLHRWLIWARFETQFYPLIRQVGWMSRMAEKVALRHLKEQVRDPDLRRKLRPDYPIGAKRVLISDDYYPSLDRDDVELVTDPIVRVEEDAVVTAGEQRFPVDCIVFATGFDTTDFLAPIDLEGRGGLHLAQEWSRGAHAYLGITVSGFPNLFLMYGPNTNLGHNSIIFMIECQTHYIIECLKKLQRDALLWMDPKREVMDAYNAEVQRRLQGAVWAYPGESWYKTKEGKITNNWHGSTVAYWWHTRTPDFADFELHRASS